MRTWMLVLVVVSIGAVGCKAGDESHNWYPPGGGGGGGGGDDTTGGGDGGIDSSATGILAGHVCVITSFDLAPDCGLAEGHNVLVAVVPGGDSQSSDATGAFALDVGAATTVELEVGSESADALVATDTLVAVTAADTDAVGVDQDLWDASLNLLGETADAGAMLVYVVDSAGAPVAGASVDFVTVPSGSPREYYDTGDGGWDGNSLVTGPDGIALILDAQTADMQATLGARNAHTTVPTSAFGVGVATITLPD